MPDVQDLGEYVNSLTTQISQGIPDGFHLKGEIEVELVVVSSKNVGGKISIMIAEAGGKYQKEELSKIKFKIAESHKGSGTLIVQS